MPVIIRKARADDVAACITIRGNTRQNPMAVSDLASVGVTETSWKRASENGELIGFICEFQRQLVGFTFRDTHSGEVMVLAMLAEYEGKGLGKRLLRGLMQSLISAGHSRLWLYASPNTEIRANGFYRHQGWRPTGEVDQHGDEVLEFLGPLD